VISRAQHDADGSCFILNGFNIVRLTKCKLLSDCNTYRTQLHVLHIHLFVSIFLKNLHWLLVHARIDFKTLTQLA